MSAQLKIKDIDNSQMSNFLLLLYVFLVYNLYKLCVRCTFFFICIIIFLFFLYHSYAFLIPIFIINLGSCVSTAEIQCHPFSFDIINDIILYNVFFPLFLFLIILFIFHYTFSLYNSQSSC